MLEPGDFVYNFMAKALIKNGDIKNIRLNEFEGKNIILIFYSMKRSMAATEQFQTKNNKSVTDKFQENIDRLNSINNAMVIGINKNPIHKQQLIKDKYLFNMAFIEDYDEEIAKLFSAYQRNDRGSSLGHIFIINGDRKVIAAWRNIRVTDTLDSVLTYINEYADELNPE